VNRFIIVTNGAVATNEGRNALTAFLEAKGWAVWHWFQDLWLVDPPGAVDIGSLRDEMMQVIPSLQQIMILSVEGTHQHAGTVPVGSIPWITEHFKRH
jgi:hypothetical protein